MGYNYFATTSDPSSLSSIYEFVSEKMKEFGVDDETLITDMQVPVSEACTNILTHAYCGKRNKLIEINCRLNSQDKLVVTIRDKGQDYREHFDPKGIRSPNTKADWSRRKNHGWGLFFIKYMTDKAPVFRRIKNRNVLTIVKTLDR